VSTASTGTHSCLHFLSYRDNNGLWIKSTDEDLLWTEFRSNFEQLNNANNHQLTLDMTSRFGIHRIKIADDASADDFFYGLIGYSAELEINRGKEIDTRFYGKLLGGKLVNQAVEEIKNELNDISLS
jgi:hypothetical protein